VPVSRRFDYWARESLELFHGTDRSTLRIHLTASTYLRVNNGGIASPRRDIS
jgi:hypothetical protein